MTHTSPLASFVGVAGLAYRGRLTVAGSLLGALTLSASMLGARALSHLSWLLTSSKGG